MKYFVWKSTVPFSYNQTLSPRYGQLRLGAKLVARDGVRSHGELGSCMSNSTSLQYRQGWDAAKESISLPLLISPESHELAECTSTLYMQTGKLVEEKTW
jgi:hypothetical protein